MARYQRRLAGLAAEAIEADTEAPAAQKAATKSHSRALRKSSARQQAAALVAALRRPEGATTAQVVEATGWQPHTVRGVLAGALKKRLWLEVTPEKINGQRVYRLPPAGTALQVSWQKVI
ncbi:MAG: DUF3489 domain-containing protein [Rhodobacteraceae bacterium]|nr:DUF3489 domain-containing protein [Paracoccaceae bacterium]